MNAEKKYFLLSSKNAKGKWAEHTKDQIRASIKKFCLFYEGVKIDRVYCDVANGDINLYISLVLDGITYHLDSNLNLVRKFSFISLDSESHLKSKNIKNSNDLIFTICQKINEEIVILISKQEAWKADEDWKKREQRELNKMIKQVKDPKKLELIKKILEDNGD